MKVYEPRTLAAEAVAARPDRPAMVVAHDTREARIVVFRIEPGQQVPPHTNHSKVVMSIVAGGGFVSGAEGERAVCAGDVIAFDPDERHGMRAEREQFVLYAVIAPRPGDH